MSIVLRPETERKLQELLETGEYPTANEAVEAGLRALGELKSMELDEETLNAIDRAEDQIECGECHDWKDVREQVRAKFLGQ